MTAEEGEDHLNGLIPHVKIIPIIGSFTYFTITYAFKDIRAEDSGQLQDTSIPHLKFQTNV